MGDAVVHTVGTKVWVKDEAESWVKAEVLRVAGEEIVLRTEKGVERTAKQSDCPLQNPDVHGVEDMTRLSYLHEPGVLWNLKLRYQLDDIYTYTGTILIAVNPFASLPHLYGPHMMDQYRGADLGDLSPHVYAIADAAYRQMRKEFKGQSILVSGESGAGKTETSKLIMKYLAYMGAFTGGGSQRSSRRSVEEQVLESNPLLEAFGNAKTVRNDNSSRFGKYVEINFNKEGSISGAAIRTYLLEKSRVVAVNNPERNYHIFYQLCDGASDSERVKWHLKAANEYRYLNQSTCYNLPNVNNAEEYKATIRAMTTVGLSPEDQEAIFRTVAGVLNMGNIIFVDSEDGEATVQAGASEEHLAATASLLGVDKAGLRKALSTRTRQTPEGPIVSPLNAKAASENRDSLAKIIYSKMFDWLVACINAAIGEDKNCAASVGVLDIYGFESFEYNDFEQFCINLANEKLQQHFNHHVFKQEQAEYEREAIDWSYIEFVDNQDVLDLIEGKMGIIDVLDEQCRFPTATRESLAQNLYSAQPCTESKRFSKPKRSMTAFTIDHYAGGVTYQCDNFLDKNKDFVVAEHQSLLQNSAFPFMTALFQDSTEQPAEAKDKGGRSYKAFKFNSVAGQFKKQLAELMDQLLKMEPHYVRCIKPNSYNKPSLFENSNALHQLRCGGVLEAVRINCAGFPSKRPYADFVDHFWPLAPTLLHSDADDQAIAKAIIDKSNITGYQLGKTKVFLRAGQMAMLDKLRTETLHAAAVRIQKHVRGFLQRKKYVRTLRAIVTIQAGVRGMFARKDARGRREVFAATLLQSVWRMHKARNDYQDTRRAVLLMQSLWRGHKTRQLYEGMRQQRASLCIQRYWRGYVARKQYRAVLRGALAVQCAYRSKVAKRELRKLKLDAREATKLLEDKKVLEVKLKEVQNTLEVVQNQRNELRQQLKDERAIVAEYQQRIKVLEAEKEDAVRAAGAAAAAEVAVLVLARDNSVQELENVKVELAQLGEKASKDKSDLERKLQVAQEYIQRMQLDKSDFEKRFSAMKDELITRLQNACSQRDEARGQVLELQAEMEKMREQMDRLKENIARDSSGLPVAVAALPAAVVAAAAATQNLPAPVSYPSTPGTPVVANGPAGAVRGVGTPSASFGKAMTDGVNYLLGYQGTPTSAGRPGVRGVDDETSRSPAVGAAGAESELERKTRELQAKQQAILAEKRKAEEEKLLSAVSGPATQLGFYKGKPLAALIIFRSCLQWRSFQLDRTSIFDRIIGVIGSQIEKQQDDNKCLAYWLTNTVTLLHLLQKNIKPASGNQYSRTRSGSVGAAAGRVFGGLFGRSPSSLANAEASIHGGGVGGFRQVEAKYPALLFKQQLDAFVQKIFPMMRDNVKKQITPMLSNCIHIPKGSARTLSSGRRGAAEQGAAAQTAVLSRAWNEILGVFDALLATVKENHVPRVLVQALFKQLFSFVNVQLFNQLLLRRECCSFSNGEYVKTGLAQVENWIQEAGTEYVGDSWDELKYIRQAVTFLVIGNKPKKSLDEITNDLCPVLSIQQLYRISTMYWDDKYNTETVSTEVLSRMKQAMVDSNSSSSHSFLLDDDSTLPFAAAEVLSHMDDKDLYIGLVVPDVLKEGDNASGFAFLEKELRFSQMQSG